MGQRTLRTPRCSGCGLHQGRCLCASRPALDLATRLIIVQHHRERHKPTNTARLAAQIYRGAELIDYGARGVAMDTQALTIPGRGYLLLFQREDAITLTPEVAASLAASGRERALVVLDGTWHQCSRMARRAPVIAELPCYALPEGGPSRWGIRTPPRPGALSTLEAIGRAMAILEGDPTATAAVDRWFTRLVAELWRMRGAAPPGTRLDSTTHDEG